MTPYERKQMRLSLLVVALISLVFGAGLGASLAGHYFLKEVAAAREDIRRAEAGAQQAGTQARQCLIELGRRL